MKSRVGYQSDGFLCTEIGNNLAPSQRAQEERIKALENQIAALTNRNKEMEIGLMKAEAHKTHLKMGLHSEIKELTVSDYVFLD
jgi:hypothetical protein